VIFFLALVFLILTLGYSAFMISRLDDAYYFHLETNYRSYFAEKKKGLYIGSNLSSRWLARRVMSSGVGIELKDEKLTAYRKSAKRYSLVFLISFGLIAITIVVASHFPF
jgi:hypothetical protein